MRLCIVNKNKGMTMMRFEITSFGRSFLECRTYNNQSPERLARVVAAVKKRYPDAATRIGRYDDDSDPYVYIITKSSGGGDLTQLMYQERR